MQMLYSLHRAIALFRSSRRAIGTFSRKPTFTYTAMNDEPDVEDVPVASLVIRPGTPRVNHSLLVRPEQFEFLTVVVPSDEDRHTAEDLPAQALDVYVNLPRSTQWGATHRMALRRLEHVKLVDHIAYKRSVAAGLKTPLPPKLRA